MYSVRVITRWHGNTQVHILLCNLIITGFLIWNFGIDYLVIFCASTLLHLLLETGLSISGIRKGDVFVYGHRLPRAADAVLRAIVEGPGFCVPAFFAADQIMGGNVALGVGFPVVIVGFASLFMGLADRRDVARLGPDEAPQMSRRAMMRPGAVMLLSLINTGCLTALFLMPDPYRLHGFIYVISYALLAILFYIFNYNLGVRMVQMYDSEKKSYTTPGPVFQAIGLAYDSSYEMALLISPAYWVTFYLGFFHYTTLS
jgi:hypothetical protein